ncbi:MAG: hypothetical protein Ct9H90mP10_04410 [Actinomycetota bacterium]|nr:MAG: hypothetical protein Ct9H90mP10_04410 [Actinomycetota bacterium]
MFAGGCVVMTKPAGTEESAAFSIPTINPSDCKSLSACACSLPVKSGISTNVGAPPSTGKGHQKHLIMPKQFQTQVPRILLMQVE